MGMAAVIYKKGAPDNSRPARRMTISSAPFS